MARWLDVPKSTVRLTHGGQIARQVAHDQRRFGLPGTAPAGQARGGWVTKKTTGGLPPMSQPTSSTARRSPPRCAPRWRPTSRRIKAQHGFAPGLAVVLVGEDPASKVYVRNKAEQTVEVGMQSFEHKLPAETTRGRRCSISSPGSTAIRPCTASWCSCRCPSTSTAEKVLELDRPGQGRRRLPPDERRPAVDRRARAGAVHAGRLDHPRKVGEARPVGPRRRRRRPLQHRRQADGAAAAARELHGDHRALAHQATFPTSCAAPISWSPPSASPRS